MERSLKPSITKYWPSTRFVTVADKLIDVRIYLRLVLFSLIVMVLTACGGGGGTVSTGAFKGISVTPASVSLKPNESFQFTAVVDGGEQAVVWSLPGLGATSTGSFLEPGKYKAPISSGSYTVRASLSSDSAKYADATVNVDSGYVVNIGSSGGSNVAYGSTKSFTATVTGASSNEVTWSAILGTVSASGVYTAPAAPVGSETTDTITATSVADPGKKRTFTVNLAQPISIVNGGTVRYALPQSRLTFQALVAGVAATSGVNWSATSGSITSAGVWTADSSTVGNVTVTATLASDATKSVTTTINVQSNLNVRFKFQTAGDIVLSLRPDKAPRHCANLVSLVNEGFYDGIKLHRREENFVVQWGDPLTKILPLTDPSIGTGGPGYTINFEANDLKHLKYSLGMARSSSLDSAGSQIYICLKDLPSLDGNYVVFGSVASGESAIDIIQVGDTVQSATVELIPSP